MAEELQSLFAEAQAYIDEHGGDMVQLVNDSKAKMGRLGNMLIEEHDDIVRGWGKYTADDRYLVRYMTTDNDGVHEFELSAQELVWDTLEQLWMKYGGGF